MSAPSARSGWCLQGQSNTAESGGHACVRHLTWCRLTLEPSARWNFVQDWTTCHRAAAVQCAPICISKPSLVYDSGHACRNGTGSSNQICLSPPVTEDTAAYCRLLPAHIDTWQPTRRWKTRKAQVPAQMEGAFTMTPAFRIR